MEQDAPSALNTYKITRVLGAPMQGSRAETSTNIFYYLIYLFIVSRGCHVHIRMFGNMSDLYPPDTSSISPAKNVSSHYQMSPGVHNTTSHPHLPSH